MAYKRKFFQIKEITEKRYTKKIHRAIKLSKQKLNYEKLMTLVPGL